MGKVSIKTTLNNLQRIISQMLRTAGDIAERETDIDIKQGADT